MRALPTLLFAFLLLAPTSLAQGELVEILDVRVPERTLGGTRFPVDVTLRNHGATEVEVSLMGALYPRAPGGSPPCGDVRTGGGKLTHTFQPVIHIQPGESITYPPANQQDWMHLYLASDAPDTPTDREFCVFAFNPQRDQTIEYYDFDSGALNVRAKNQAPEVSFTWSPESPGATRDVHFVGTASDADGDPVSYRWDFGHANASGHAYASGPEAFHPFFPAGSYTVTLSVSDGFEERSVSRTVVVGPEDSAEPVDVEPRAAPGRSVIPVPVHLLAGAAMLAALLARRVGR